MSIYSYRFAAATFLMIATSFAAADVRTDLISQWGGCSYAVVLRNGLAYAGIGPRLTIIDLADPDNPLLIGQSEPLGSIVDDIAIAGNLAYVAVSGAGVKIIDISVPARPVVISTFQTPDWAVGVSIWERFACVSLFSDGLLVLDVSNPTAPQAVWELFTNSYRGGIIASDGFAYYTSPYNLTIVDLARDGAPAIVGSLPGFSCADMRLRDGLLYGAATQGGVRIANIADPAAPRIVGEAVDTDRPNPSSAIALAGKYSWINETGWEGGMRSYDVSDPTHPRLIAGVATDGWSDDLDVKGGLAVLENWAEGLHVFDVSNAAAPVRRSTYEEAQQTLRVAVEDNYAFLMGWPGPVVWMDISTPEAPRVLNRLGNEFGGATAFDGRFAYVVEESYLAIYDLGNPPHVTVRGRVELPQGSRAIVNRNGFVYIPFSEAAFQGGVAVVDARNPDSPVHVNTIEAWSPMDVAISGNLLLHVDSGNGLNCYDISNPADPNFIGSLATRGYPMALTLINEYAYIATSAGIDVMNFSNPTYPVPVAFLRTEIQNEGICTLGEYVVTSSGRVIDASLPDHPRWAGEYLSQGWPNDVAANGRVAVFAADAGGAEFVVIRRVGDLNGDNAVDLYDLVILLASFGICDTAPGYDSLGDLDGNDCVGVADLAILLAAF